MTTILITGANRGLGFEMVRRYSEKQSVSVIACCRKPGKAGELNALSNATSNVIIEKLDVVDIASIESLGARLGDQPIDILINNAGIFGKSQPATTGFQDQVFGKSDFEPDWIAPYRTNVIGPMKIAETLVENVANSTQKKIVVITSIVGSIATAQGYMFGYASSKAAANMMAKNLAIALKGKNIIVNPVHPGYAKTDMGGEAAFVDVEDAVDDVLRLIDTMSLANTGEFLSFDGRQLPW